MLTPAAAAAMVVVAAAMEWTMAWSIGVINNNNWLYGEVGGGIYHQLILIN